MAAALAFRSLFAMLPVVVVATVVVKGARGTEDFKKVVSWLINALGLRDVQIVPPDQMMAGASAAAAGRRRPWGSASGSRKSSPSSRM